MRNAFDPGVYIYSRKYIVIDLRNVVNPLHILLQCFYRRSKFLHHLVRHKSNSSVT